MTKTDVIIQSKAKKEAFLGILFAFTLVLSYIEFIVPLDGVLPPGIKLGLSNITVMYCLFFLGLPSALSVAVLKSGFVLITRGAVASLLSLSGGLGALFLMFFLIKAGKMRLSGVIISVFGSISHNLCQIVVSSWLTGTNLVYYYLPVLLISGVVMGIVTGLTLRAVLPAVGKLRSSI